MTMNQSSHDDYVLKLFNLDRKNIELFHVSHQNNELHIETTLAVVAHNCPVCTTPTTKIKDYKTKSITHSVVTGIRCIIRYHARRYQCPTCKKSFLEHNPFALPGSKVSLLTVYNVLNDLKKANETFTSVADRHHLSVSTVSALFDKHVRMSRLTLPEVINIDEVYAFHSEKSKYVCVLLDFLTKDIIDVLPERTTKALTDYFYKIPLEERKKPKLVVSDMWESYRVVAKEMLPNAKVAVDKFHMFQELLRQMQRVRIDAMNLHRVPYVNYKTASSDVVEKHKEHKKVYNVYKKFYWLLTTSDDKLIDYNRTKEYNKFLKQYVNYRDLLNMMLNDSIAVNEVYQLYYLFSQFYAKSEPHNAYENLTAVIKQFKESNIKEMNTFGNTMTNWKNEIVNSFERVGDRKQRVNNAIIENRNKIIKNMKHNSNGFTNWDRFRNRVLYVINHDATFKIYPAKNKE